MNEEASLRAVILELKEEVAALRVHMQGGLKTCGSASPPPDQGLLSAQELAGLAGFSVHTVRDWCQQGLLPAEKIGNRWRIPREKGMLALKKMNRRRRRKCGGQGSA